MNTITKFPLGHVVMTPGAADSLSPQEMSFALQRHLSTDWGELDADDKRANDHALQCGGRLLSAYTSLRGELFWIITEADRSATTILLPHEY